MPGHGITRLVAPCHAEQGQAKLRLAKPRRVQARTAVPRPRFNHGRPVTTTSTTSTPGVAYAMSDMAPSADGRTPAGVVSVAPDRGGCGRQHTAEVDDDGHVLIRCDTCAPWLIGNVHGFAATPAGVPLTPDEMGEVEISKRQGEVSYHLAMKAMGETMGQIIQSTTGKSLGHAPAPEVSASSLKAQLAAMSPEDRAELLGALAPAAEPEPEKKTPAAAKSKAASPGKAS